MNGILKAQWRSLILSLTLGLLAPVAAVIPDYSEAATVYYPLGNTGAASDVCPGTATANQTSGAFGTPGRGYNWRPMYTSSSPQHFNWTDGATGNATSAADDMYSPAYDVTTNISSLELWVSGTFYCPNIRNIYAKFYDVDGSAACPPFEGGDLIGSSGIFSCPVGLYETWSTTAKLALTGLNYDMQPGHRIRIELWIGENSSGYAIPVGGTLYVSGTSTAFTTVGPGTVPPDASLGPGGATTDLDAFTLQTSAGTDHIGSLTVTVAPAGAFNNIDRIDITSDDGLTTYGSRTNMNPAYTATGLSFGQALTATTTPTQYRVRITPKSHAAMPPVPGASYSITGTVTAIGSMNTVVYSDATATTVTVDNLSPADPAWGSVIAGASQVSLNWTRPADQDLDRFLILKNSVPVTDVPAEGADYSEGSAIGTSRVVYAGSSQSFIDSDLTEGYTAYYRIFSSDAHGNYSSGPGTGPHPPAITVGNGTDPSDTTLDPGGAATTLDSFSLVTPSPGISLTSVTVSLAPGNAPALAKMEITNDSGAVVYGAVTEPLADAVVIPLTTAISVPASVTQYRVRITPKSYSTIPVPSGGIYVLAGTVTAVTAGQYSHYVYGDTASARITIDNFPGKAYNLSCDTVHPLYTITPGEAFTVRARVMDQADGSPITGLGASDILIGRITNMADNRQLTAGTDYTGPVFAEAGEGNYDLTLVLHAGTTPGDILQVEVRAATGTFVDGQWLAATQYVRVGTAGAAENARYVEIQPSTAGTITAMAAADGAYPFRMRLIDATGTSYHPGNLTWRVSTIRTETGETPPGAYTVTALWNAGGWFDCTMEMKGATLLAGSRYYIVVTASSGNYSFTQSMGLTARAAQTFPAIAVPAFTDPSLDMTPPDQVTLTVTPDSGNGYVTSNITVSGTFTDNESCIKSCEYTLDGVTWQSSPAPTGVLPDFTCTATIPGLSNGNSLSIGMRATSSGGTGTAATPLHRTVDTAGPSDGVLTVTPGYKTNVLSWTAAVDAGTGLDTANTYVVVSNVGGGIPFDCSSPSPLYQGTGTTFTHTGLLSGWAYNYRVCAYDKFRYRSAGATGSGTTLTDSVPPAEISGTLAVSPDTGTHIPGTFTITEDFLDAQTPVTTCRYSIDGGAKWNLASGAVSAGPDTYRCTANDVTGTDGLAVTIRMKATSDGGESTPAASITRTVDSAAPADGVFTVTPGNRANVLNWTAATDSGSGLAAAPYRVVYTAGPTPPMDCASGTHLYSGSDLTYTHLNLINLTAYSYRICALDRAGYVSPGRTASATPGNPATTAGAAAAVPFSSGWTSGIAVIMPYTDDANANSTCTVDFKPVSDSVWYSWGDLNHGPSPFQASLGLTPGEAYDLKVTYHDPDGVTGAAVQILTSIRVPSDRLLHNSRNANKKNYWSQYGGWGLPGTQYGEFTCATCHEPRGQNIAAIKSFINLFPIPNTSNHFGGPVHFISRTGPDSFGDDSLPRSQPPSRICEVCHTQTYGRTGPTTQGEVHRYNQTEIGNHANANGTDCTVCHTHNTGFSAPW